MSEERFEEWAIVELFGHGRLAGRVTAEQIGGASFVRVDVPETPEISSHRLEFEGGGNRIQEALPGFTKFYGPGAIYAIFPTDEATARRAVAAFREQPIGKWRLPVREVLLPVPIGIGGIGSLGEDGGDISGIECEEECP